MILYYINESNYLDTRLGCLCTPGSGNQHLAPSVGLDISVSVEAKLEPRGMVNVTQVKVNILLNTD